MAKVEHGEFRNQLALDLQSNLEKTVNRYQKRPPYWLLVYAAILDDVVYTKILRLSQCPPKMLGTMCYYVDNKEGQLKRLWVLPLDIPRDPGVIDLESGLEEIAKSADADVLVY